MSASTLCSCGLLPISRRLAVQTSLNACCVLCLIQTQWLQIATRRLSLAPVLPDATFPELFLANERILVYVVPSRSQLAPGWNQRRRQREHDHFPLHVPHTRLPPKRAILTREHPLFFLCSPVTRCRHSSAQHACLAFGCDPPLPFPSEDVEQMHPGGCCHGFREGVRLRNVSIRTSAYR
ncbi:uncharacterized protein EI97DRAFT_290501 [Westerdykella ornata]|uniref:Uncharacterized protein n=1 Tax=Westerdykella ornata TaxID=318751 RepID=A0A6A6JNZ7_WESOR|nr:uncharacterized protein EI97DRAFT_290501 [Westerdykella ornata]KAF2277406.1 hypothetical protein EI97DRAFT_290501 [Westerdykella ornata]